MNFYDWLVIIITIIVKKFYIVSNFLNSWIFAQLVLTFPVKGSDVE